MSTLNKLGQLFSQKVVRSLSAGVAAGTVMCAVGAVAQPANAALIGGVDIDKFASYVIVDGDFDGPNGDFLTGFTDELVETYGFAVNGQGFALFGFNEQVFNGAGADIALFDLDSSLAQFKVIINGITRVYDSVFTDSFTNDSNRFPVNVARVELSDFGLVDGDFINEILIDFNTESSPSLALVGSLQRSVPEPSAMFGLLATIGFLASQRGLKFAKKAQ